ncbi:MAG: DUF4340 domain-containing protein [Oscillospiraceae bacterium]|nr:DUF4340 domain-containing protein [Oscillospiraceae bacterium]
MKLKYQIILFAGIFVAALAAAVIVLQVTRGGDIETDVVGTQSEGDEIRLFSFEENEVNSINIVNQNNEEGYFIVSDATRDYYAIKQISEKFPEDMRADIPYNQSALKDLAVALGSLTLTALVEREASDLERYGLTTQNHTARVGVILKDGGRHAFLIGNLAPGGTEYYFCTSESQDVYTIRVQDAGVFMVGQYHWLERLMFPMASTLPDIDRIIINRIDWDEAGQEKMVIEPLPESQDTADIRSPNRHKLTSPVNLEIDPETSNGVVNGLFGMSASEIVTVTPDDEELKTMGLMFGGDNPPTCMVEAVTGNTIHRLVIGTYLQDESGNKSGHWFALSSYAPGLVFLVPVELLPWLYVEPGDLLAEMFAQPFIYGVDTLTVKTPDNESVFVITGDMEKNQVTHNGELLKGSHKDSSTERGRFADLYMFIISVRADELFTDELPEDSEPIVSVKYTFRDENSEDLFIEYYEAEDFRTIVRINGMNLFKMRSHYSERLVSNLAAFEAGETIINDW